MNRIAASHTWSKPSSGQCGEQRLPHDVGGVVVEQVAITGTIGGVVDERDNGGSGGANSHDGRDSEVGRGPAWRLARGDSRGWRWAVDKATHSLVIVQSHTGKCFWEERRNWLFTLWDLHIDSAG